MQDAKYIQVVKTLKHRIKNDKYKLNTPLPNQNDLAKEFNVSRMTVKKALDILAMEGLIYSKRGLGTFIRKNALTSTKEDLSFNEYTGLSQNLKRPIESKIIKFDVKFPDETLCERLDITPTDPIYEILRLRIVDEQPYVLEHTFMPLKIVPNLDLDILKKSLYHYLQTQLNLKISGAFRKITAEKSTELDQKYLESKEHDPILQISQIVYLEDGRPFEVSTSRHPYDKHAYTMVDIHQQK